MPADQLFARLGRALAGRYTLVRELGAGGMATVCLATDIKLGRWFSLRAPDFDAVRENPRFRTLMEESGPQ
jgi:serine/threonine protein kinase